MRTRTEPAPPIFPAALPEVTCHASVAVVGCSYLRGSIMRLRLIFLVSAALLAGRTSLGADLHHVRLLIRDGSRPAAGVAVVVRYPDGEHTNGAGLTLSANNAGVAEFAIPANSFWLTIRELN